MTENNKPMTFVGRAGTPHRLGAQFVNQQLEYTSTEQATGVNFAVFAPEATELYLCLFDDNNSECRLRMKPSLHGVWHLKVEGIAEGQAYGLRADGRWSPDEGLRFNVNKLLADPYAKEIKGHTQWCNELYDYQGSHRSEWVMCQHNNQYATPRSIVRSDEFDWQGTTHPHQNDSGHIIYEAHVKGFTQKHPEIPEELRGTYLGMCHPVAIAYLKKLGITTVELMPVTSFVSEARLSKLGLKNYWGYNPLCMMAPEPSYAKEDPVTELKTLVRELHKAGIRVVMDVVFNHTCEAGSDGPSLSLRGLAEKAYYLLEHHDGHLHSTNFSGCGNTMNFDSMQTTKLMMDSLRHWVEHYHIDGFRFDLAPTMARRNRQFDPKSSFFQAIHQDPVLAQRQMIAEPWDIGPDGYRLTGFPKTWQEWNDRYRDGCRAFWRGDRECLVELALRMVGSKDLFRKDRHAASINYICSHDGFNINDLVSYDRRHNLANGEEGRDGDEHNVSWNHGVEGSTDDPVIIAQREQAKRNLFATVLFSRGCSMFLAGDEFGHTHQGNNNVYCQDNTISWLDWSLTKEGSKGAELLDFVSQLTQLKQSYPVLKACHTDDSGHMHTPKHEWFTIHGSKRSAEQLSDVNQHAFGLRFYFDTLDESDLIILINNQNQSQRFHLPSEKPKSWQRIVHTANKDYFAQETVLEDGWIDAPENSLLVIKGYSLEKQ